MSEVPATIPISAENYPCCDPATCPGCGCCNDAKKAQTDTTSCC